MSGSEHDEQPAFSCPHCGGPVHVAAVRVVECEVGHSFTLGALELEQTRYAARAAWRAVRALEERADMIRWSLEQSELSGIGDRDEAEAQARRDEETSRQLRQYAGTLDLTLRIQAGQARSR